MLPECRGSVEPVRSIKGRLQGVAREEPLGKSPCHRFEANDIDAALAPLDQQMHRAGIKIDGTQCTVVIGQDGAPYRIDRIVQP